MKHTLFSLLLWATACLSVCGADIPGEHVFVFGRSTNSNYICYDINLLADGTLNKKEPLKSYWVLGDGKRTEELTFLDRKMAFGIKVLSSDGNEARVHMTAYKDLVIRVCQHNGKWVGIVSRNGHELILSRMFAQMKASIYPKCEYVDVFGNDVTTGEKRRERVTP